MAKLHVMMLCIDQNTLIEHSFVILKTFAHGELQG